MTTKLKSQEPPPGAAIPTVKYLMTTYGNTLSDQKKLAEIFKRFESAEKERRLLHELQLVRDGKVSEKTLDSVVGKRVAAPFEGYTNWAAKMLMYLAAAKK